MEIKDTVRKMRELREWSQEEMAERLGMSTNGYAKIERGETHLTIAKLEKIAEVFDINLNDLLSVNERSIICLINENSQHSSNYYGVTQELNEKIKELQLIISHRDEMLMMKDQLLSQKENEIKMLNEMLILLKKQLSDT